MTGADLTRKIVIETLEKMYGITVKDGELHIKTKRIHVDQTEVHDD